jgi:thymidylate synthase ThyX
MAKFDAKKLIDDCGGPRAVAEQLGKARTAPYRMIRTRFMNTHQLEKLIENNPNLNLNHYFEETTDATKTKGGNV